MADIWGQIILCLVGCFVQCEIFTGVPVLYSLDVSSDPLSGTTKNISSENRLPPTCKEMQRTVNSKERGTVAKVGRSRRARPQPPKLHGACFGCWAQHPTEGNTTAPDQVQPPHDSHHAYKLTVMVSQTQCLVHSKRNQEGE
jgi:hypothetical protein